jgi:hypothetical protein
VPQTPDRNPGPLEELVEIRLGNNPVDPSRPGAFDYDGASFRFRDAAGVFDPRTGGSGLTAEQHKVLRQLIHFIDDGPAEGFPSGCYKETLPAGNPFPTSEIWYESNAKLKKIVSLSTTWVAAKITQEVWEIYDTDGATVLWRITDAITYSGVFETSKTRTIAAGP